MNNINRISKYSYHIVNSLCNKSETLISKSTLLGLRKIDFDKKILHSSKFIYNELPIRFSRRIKELEDLPLQLDNKHEIFQIRDWYINSLDDITLNKCPKNIDDCFILKDTIDKIYTRHSSTLNVMSKGINKLKDSNLISNNTDFFLNNFYYNRTKTRFLISNYLNYFDKKDNKIGSLYMDCNITDLINDAYKQAVEIAEINRLLIPDIKINIINNNFIYPKEYLNYCLTEVLKNSIVALQKNENPIIEINSFIDKNLIFLKISDNGKGIKKENMELIWNYSFTTDKINYDNLGNNVPISGYGYGLPITKVLLNTFNGDIKLYSNINKGTDVYITIDLNSDWKF